MVIKFYSQNNLKESVLLGLQRDRLHQGKGGMGTAREDMEGGTGLVGHISIPYRKPREMRKGRQATNPGSQRPGWLSSSKDTAESSRTSPNSATNWGPSV